MSGVATHLLEVLLFVAFAAAPLPWALLVIREMTAPPSLARAALVTLMLWCALQAALAHLLGLFGLLLPPAVIAGELLLLGLGAIAVLGSRRSGPAATRPPLPSLSPSDIVVMLSLVMVVIMLAWWSAAMAVVDWDSWAFHMPPMADWLQNGSFTRQAQYAQTPKYSYPFGWEALCTLFLVPFGEDVFVTLPNLVVWMLLGAAVYTLARQFGALRTPALAAAALLLVMPGIAHVVNTLHVDVPFAALFMASAAFGVSWARTGALIDLGLGALALGLACATRVTGPAYAPLLLIWVAGLRARGSAAAERPAGDRLAPVLGIAGVALGLFVGAFWYGKNLIDLGHPFGTAAVGTGGYSLERAISNTLAANVHPLKVSSWAALYRRAFGELDLSFVALVALAALCPLAWLRQPGRRAVRLLAPSLLVGGTAAIFWITPAAAMSGIQLRLGFPFVAGIALLGALGASAARLRPEVLALLVAVATARSLAGSRTLFLVVPLALGWGLWGQVPARLRRLVPALAVVGLIALTWVARPRREQGRREYYGPTYEHLERYVRPNEPVAYMLGDRSYILYGRRLARPVVFAPVADGESLEDWGARLRQRGIGLVAVGPYQPNPPIVALVERLSGPLSPVIAISGRGQPGEVTLFQLRAR